MGEFVLDVHGDLAEEVDVLAVRWGYVGEQVVVDPATCAAHLLDSEPVVLGGRQGGLDWAAGRTR